MAGKKLTIKQKASLKAKAASRRFKEEMKKTVNTAIVAAFSFLIALSWRDVITGYVNKIEEISPVKGSLISAIIITLVSVIGIIIFTKIFSERE